MSPGTQVTYIEKRCCHWAIRLLKPDLFLSQVGSSLDFLGAETWKELPKWRRPGAVFMLRLGVSATLGGSGGRPNKELDEKDHSRGSPVSVPGCMLHVRHVSLACTHCLRAGPNEPSLLLSMGERRCCLSRRFHREGSSIYLSQSKDIV